MIIGNATSRLTTNQRFGDTVTLIKNTGSYVNGAYVDGTPQTISVRVHHQPSNADDRSNLPEGERLREAITVWIKSSDREFVRPVRQGVKNSKGDIFQIGGINYEVYSVDNFSLDQHIKAICMRIENQSD
ncbi:MAG: hypothetical protein V3V61_01310 [Gammaproteobacteria bacterium]